MNKITQLYLNYIPFNDSDVLVPISEPLLGLVSDLGYKVTDDKVLSVSDNTGINLHTDKDNPNLSLMFVFYAPQAVYRDDSALDFYADDSWLILRTGDVVLFDHHNTHGLISSVRENFKILVVNVEKNIDG